MIQLHSLFDEVGIPSYELLVEQCLLLLDTISSQETIWLLLD